MREAGAAFSGTARVLRAAPALGEPAFGRLGELGPGLPSGTAAVREVVLPVRRPVRAKGEASAPRPVGRPVPVERGHRRPALCGGSALPAVRAVPAFRAFLFSRLSRRRVACSTLRPQRRNYSIRGGLCGRREGFSGFCRGWVGDARQAALRGDSQGLDLRNQACAVECGDRSWRDVRSFGVRAACVNKGYSHA